MEQYTTANQMADFLMKLYDSDSVIGRVDRNTFDFEMSDGMTPCARK